MKGWVALRGEPTVLKIIKKTLFYCIRIEASKTQLKTIGKNGAKYCIAQVRFNL